jgi:hypothetical protein
VIEIELSDVEMQLRVNAETGIRTMRFLDPMSGIAVRVSMDEVGAKQIASGLMPQSSVIEVPEIAVSRGIKH